MQWSPVSVLLLLAATAVNARLHGHDHRHVHPRHALEPDLIPRDDVVDMVTTTVVEIVVVTVTTTIYDEPTAVVMSVATTAVIEAPPAPEQDLRVGGITASLGIDLPGILPARPTTTASAPKPPAGGSNSGSSNWAAIPAGQFSTAGFGGRTSSSGTGIGYSGNVGNPWGSNIIEVDANSANQYKYVVQFTGSNVNPWVVVFWNKIGPDGKLDGWYGHSALTLTLPPGETKYIAFDENSQGGWGAAEGTSLPTDEFGGYSCTWGEFDFGNSANGAWSGWDVSAIQAEAAGQKVQGMRICSADGQSCSVITTGAEKVVNAYTKNLAAIDGIGGNANTAAVRLAVHVDYSG